MNVYRNRNWTRRDYEQTNIIAVVSDKLPTIGFSGAKADYWVKADEALLIGLEQIGKFNGMTFCGYL